MKNKIQQRISNFFGSQRGKFLDLSNIRELNKRGIKVYY